MACENVVPLTGGAQYHVFYLSRCLDTLGHHITIKTQVSDGFQESYSETSSNIRYKFTQTAERGIWSLVQFPFNLLSAIFEIRNYELIHVHYSSKFAAIYSLAARMHRIPCVVTLHGRGTLDSSVQRSFTARIWRKIAFKNVAACIAPSLEIGELAEKLTKKSIYMIPNGVEVENFTFKQRFVDSRIIFCSLRRLVQKNGVKIALLILVELALLEPNRKFLFLICGDGPEKDELVQISDTAPVNLDVEFLGQTSHQEMSNSLESATFSMFFSSAEAISLALLETMALGLIPVASNVGGLAEVIQTEKNGFLIGDSSKSDYTGNSRINSKQIKAHALALQRIINLPTYDLQHISDKARETSNKYSWNEIAQTTDKLYFKLRDSRNYSRRRFSITINSI